MLDLKNLSSEINLKIQQVKDRDTLESLKTLYLGKKGIINRQSIGINSNVLVYEISMGTTRNRDYVL